MKGENSLAVADAIHDTDRVNYFAGMLDSLLKAKTEDGVDVRSYFGWSELCWVPRHMLAKLISNIIRSSGQFRMVRGLRRSNQTAAHLSFCCN